MRWTERQRAMLREMGVVLAPEPLAAMPSNLMAPAAATSAVVPAVGPSPATLPVAAPPARVAGVAVTPVAASAAVLERSTARSPEPATSEWLVVGEALDAATAGEESVLLDNMLRAIGITRSARAGAPVARYVGLAAWPAVAAADPAAACVLVLGRAAAAAVLGSAEPLGTLRGRLHRWQGRPAVVTFSLAYLLRHPADKAKAWADLCLAVQAVDEPAWPAAAVAAMR